MSFLLNTSQDILAKATKSHVAMHMNWLALPSTQHRLAFLEINRFAEG